MRCNNREELRFWEQAYLAYMDGPQRWRTDKPSTFADGAIEARRLREPEPEAPWHSKAPFRD